MKKKQEELFKVYYTEKVEAGLEEFKQAMIKLVKDRDTLGVGEAVDLTSQLIAIGQIEAGIKNTKDYLMKQIEQS